MQEVKAAAELQFFLFSLDPAEIAEAEAAAIDAIVVDLEQNGKRERQLGADTAVSGATFADLARVRKATGMKLLCRINNKGADTPSEARQAFDEGADEVIIPMVRRPAEVERVIAGCAGPAKTGILIETVEAVKHARELGALPLTRIYIGLNDLSIERGTYPNIFTPLIDGTLQRLREAVQVPFGFGGLTLPQLGYPIPCNLLMCEMLRLRCSFTFLRRSFQRDVPRGAYAPGIKSIRAALHQLAQRDSAAGEELQRQLEQAIKGWSTPANIMGVSRVHAV